MEVSSKKPSHWLSHEVQLLCAGMGCETAGPCCVGGWTQIMMLPSGLKFYEGKSLEENVSKNEVT